MGSSLDELPTMLEPMRVYLKRAAELRRTSSLAAFAVRTFALQVGLTHRERLRPADLSYLMSLMEELESDKAALNLSPTGEEQERATHDLAMDLYARAHAADRLDISHPHPSMKWTVVEAPRVAQAYHASAVLIDALRQFDAPPSEKVVEMQTAAHRRSQQLSAQLARALNSTPCVPMEWRPFPPSMLHTYTSIGVIPV